MEVVRVSVTVNITLLLQWKKKVDKMKAQTRFKAVGSIAKLSTVFINGGNNVIGDGEERKTEITDD